MAAIVASSDFLSIRFFSRALTAVFRKRFVIYSIDGDIQHFRDDPWSWTFGHELDPLSCVAENYTNFLKSILKWQIEQSTNIYLKMEPHEGNQWETTAWQSACPVSLKKKARINFSVIGLGPRRDGSLWWLSSVLVAVPDATWQWPCSEPRDLFHPRPTVYSIPWHLKWKAIIVQLMTSSNAFPVIMCLRWTVFLVN